MSGGGRRFVNLGVYDQLKRVYSLRRLDLSKMEFFHQSVEETAAHAKVVPTLTPAKAWAPNRRRSFKTALAAAEAAAPKIKSPKSQVMMRPPVVSSSLPTNHVIHFFPTASENKVILGDRANNLFRFDTGEHCRCIDSMPNLHQHKDSPLAISVPPSALHLHDGEDAGDLYIIDQVLHPDMAESRPQFEALLWRGRRPSAACRRSWHCDILPLPPWIIHHKHALVYGHALVGGDTICFSISGAEGTGTYCFHTATREWSKAGDWIMPFNGKAEYVPELGLWFGLSRRLPIAVDLSGVVRGEEPLPDKLRIWEDDDLPEECTWQPNELCDSKIISLGSGRFFFAGFFNDMKFDKDSSEMVTGQQFALFTGMEVVYGNGNGVNKDNFNCNSGNNGTSKDDGNNANNGSKGKGMIRGLRMIKHKSKRYMFTKQLSIEAVL
ncbi:uncharacterized protein LOC119280892 [Triticum dicoccoides]|nr:uncharacterized protein LOC119280892 [Triticum dicoccoides]